MDLFQLLGTISINNSDAVKALDETSKSGQQAESKLGKAFNAVGKGAVAVGKTIATGMAVGATAVGALVTKSIQSYADYEQLVGGVETLFKDSAEKVQEYAANAYKTAGLSANDYMETVTSFSASLLQSLEGDTNKAADYAQMAITDMADNANKMGTDMSMIQNAYQGFAKANYTMLDNLKLGYGGTQEEMARLLADAQAISGIEYDMSSYADIVDAIHVIQTEMGITGTTAKEASSTISGSMASMKASWQNLLTAISTDDLPFDTYVDNFVDSVSTVADNLMPRIEIALNGVVKLIDKLAPVIMSKIPSLFTTLLPSVITAATNLIQSLVDIIPELVSTLTSLLPEVVNGFGRIVTSLFIGIEDMVWDAGEGLVDGVVDAFGSLIEILPTLLESIMYTLAGAIPALVKGATNAITKIVDLIPGIIEILTNHIPLLIEDLTKALFDALPILVDSLASLLEDLIDYVPIFTQALLDLVVNMVTLLVEQLPVLLPILIQVIMDLVTLLIDQIPIILPLIVQACLTIISLLQEQLPVLIPMLIDAVIAIVYLLIDQLPVIIPLLIEAVITVVMAIVDALPDILKALTDALPGILQAVWDAIVMLFENLPLWFEQLFQGIVDIIKGIWSVLKGFFSDLWEAIKQTFAPVGQWFKNAFTNGKEGIKAAWSDVKGFFSDVWNKIKTAFSPATSYFRESFQNAWNAVKNVFSGVGTFFLGIWDKIKNAFSSLGTKIGDAISGAVRSGINGLIGSAEGIINGFLGMINNAISMINKIPGVNISRVKLVSFTRLAEGGVVDKATPAVFGEDGAEAVVPLEKNTGWLNKVAKQLHEFSLETKDDYSTALSRRSVDLQQRQLSETQTLNDKVDRIIELLVQFFPEMMEALNINMYLDGDMLVAGTVDRYDEALGKITIKKGRGR